MNLCLQGPTFSSPYRRTPSRRRRFRGCTVSIRGRLPKPLGPSASVSALSAGMACVSTLVEMSTWIACRVGSVTVVPLAGS